MGEIWWAEWRTDFPFLTLITSLAWLTKNLKVKVKKVWSLSSVYFTERFSKNIQCDNDKIRIATDLNFGEILNNNLAWFTGLKRYMQKQVDHSKLYRSTNVLGWKSLLQKRLRILNNNKTWSHYNRVTAGVNNFWLIMTSEKESSISIQPFCVY